MDTESTAKVEVILTAIDGDQLVLETVPNKDTILWPLKSIPRPLQVGSRLTLELQSNYPDSASPRNLPDHSGRVADLDQKKRKMLEELVN